MYPKRRMLPTPCIDWPRRLLTSKVTQTLISSLPGTRLSMADPTVHRCLQHKAPQLIHDGLLHPHLRHCSSPASAVRRLPSAVRTATPAFDVRSSVLLWPARRPYQTICEIRRIPLTVFSGTWKFFFSRFTGVHSALEALRLCAI